MLCREVLLRGVGLIFMIAFCSYYVQIPGLYGDDGIVPVHHTMKRLEKMVEAEPDFISKFQRIPTLLFLHSELGLKVETCLELVCAIGVLLSLVILLGHATVLPFIAVTILYRSCVIVGDIFMHFQWDILLVETGLVCAAMAPFTRGGLKDAAEPALMWLPRVLAFKLMLMSGIVKLQSGCPTWSGLTALAYHFASQCIPNPIAWYAHHLPLVFNKLGVVATFLIQGPITMLMISPISPMRSFSGFSHVLLQLFIICTGNYNFFNLLSIIICLSLFNFESRMHKLDWVIMGICFVFIGYYSLDFLHFHMELLSSWPYLKLHDVTLKKHPQEIVNVELQWIAPALYFVLLWVVAESVVFFHTHILNAKVSFLRRLKVFVSFIVRTGFAVVLIVVLFGPMEQLGGSLAEHRQKIRNGLMLPTIGIEGMVSGYGLFRRMTGVGPDAVDEHGDSVPQVARPEVIIEVTNDYNNWYELSFKYKVGNESRVPPWIAPHQPRLDWQMWFAALGSYQHNPWLLSFLERILSNAQPAWDLIDDNRFMWHRKPLLAARAQLYHYDFSKPPTADWWVRTFHSEYLPAVNRDSIRQALKSIDMLPGPDKHSTKKGSWQDNVTVMMAKLREKTGIIMCALITVAATAIWSQQQHRTQKNSKP